MWHREVTSSTGWVTAGAYRVVDLEWYFNSTAGRYTQTQDSTTPEWIC